MAVGLPRELEESDLKYEKAVESLLGKAVDDLDARKKLSELNKSFLKHLRDISPKLLARNPDYGSMLAGRVEILKWKTSFSLEVTELDARNAIESLSGAKVATEAAAAVVPDRGAPSGEMESRDEDGNIRAGDPFEIKGRTKNIPDDHVVQVFAAPRWKAIYTREARKIPDKRFALNEVASEVWAGSVEYYLMCVPLAVMDEIDVYMVARRRWEEGGFREDGIPVFKGQPTKNLYIDTLEKLGGIRLDTAKFTYLK